MANERRKRTNRLMRRLLQASGGAIAYLLRDEFTTALTAGNVDTTAAEPGPGTRSVQDDTGPSIAIASGKLTMAGQGDWNTAEFFYTDTFSRAAGRILVASMEANIGTNAMWGWNTDPATAGGFAGFNDVGWAMGGSLSVVARGTSGAGSPTLFTVAANLQHLFLIALRASGRMLLYKPNGGSNWLLAWMDGVDATATLYAGCVINTNTETHQFDYVKIPNYLWLPTPLLSDGYGGNVEDADGLGHAETSGVGAGGTGTSVWRGGEFGDKVSGITITPTVGADLLTNGDFSAWTGDDPDGWTVVGEVASDPMVTEVSGAARFYSSATSNNPQLTQWPNLGTSNWYLGTLTISAYVSGSVDFRDGGGGWKSTGRTAAGTFTHAKRATNGFVGLIAGGAPTDLTIDTASVKQITIASCFSNTFSAPADLTVQADIASTPANYAAGVVARLDSTTTPANYLLAYHDGTNAVLEKYVAGTVTSLISSSAAFSAGATLKVICNGANVELWYNGSQVGATQTVGDAGILSNTIHGAFATDASITIDNLQGVGTWTNGSGTTKNAAIGTAEMLTDADMETDPANNYTQVGTPSTFAQSATQANGGTYSLHMVTDAGSEGATQTVTAVVGQWYRFSLYGYKVSGTWNLDATGVVNPSGGGAGGFLSWAQAVKVWRASSTTIGIRYQATATGAEAYMDDASIKLVPLSSMIKAANVGDPDIVVDVTTPAYATIAPVGLVARLDDPDNPANFILMVWSGNSYVEVLEYVAGVSNQLGIVVTTWGANDTIRLVLDGTALSAYHITAAGVATLKLSTTTAVTTGNYAGTFASEVGNTLNNFVCYARGTGGEYDNVLNGFTT